MFHHFSDPFPEVVGRAEHHLKRAKRAYAGSESAISFLDLTSDGDRPVGVRELTLGWLSDNEKTLGDLAAVPPAQRSQLLQLLRECAEPEYRQTGTESPEEALERRIKTMDLPVVVDLAHGGGDPNAGRVALRLALDLARWWPPNRPSTPLEA